MEIGNTLEIESAIEEAGDWLNYASDHVEESTVEAISLLVLLAKTVLAEAVKV